jgi:Type I restriction modification DNA specificity domain
MRMIALGNLVNECRSGFASGKKDSDGIVQLRMNNVTTDGNIIWDKIRRVPKPKKIEELIAEPGDIFFNATNSPELVGKSALFLGHEEPITFSNHFIRIRLNNNIADSGYVSRVLQKEWSKGTFAKLCKQWVNQAAVSKESLFDLKIPLPPIEEQKRIAAILDQADSLRRARRQAIEKLNSLSQSIFYDMLGDPSSNPHGFPVGTIRDLVREVKYGSAKKAHLEPDGLPILRMGNITYGGELDLNNLKYVHLADKEIEKYTAQKGDILFNRTNSKELVGKTAVFDKEEPFAIAGYLVRARTNEKANPYYISGYLNSAHGKKTLLNMCKNIVGMANINAQEFQDIKITIPPIELQNEFYGRLELIDRHKAELQKTLTVMETLFLSLQQRAFRGEL